jgi:hypothetical protein
MYGDQAFLDMHHCFVLVILNLEQPAQEVPFTRNLKNIYIHYIPNLLGKITSNIYNRKKIKLIQTKRRYI